MKLLRMTDLPLRGQRVLIREDLNVPVQGGQISSDARIRAAVPTLRLALDQGARVLILSHLGRPKEGKPEEKYSLAPVAARLSELLGRAVPLVRDWLDGVDCPAGAAVLCENVRFNVGEKADDEALALFGADYVITRNLIAAMVPLVVLAALASTRGRAGPLLVAELTALERALADPARPMIAIVAGSKVSTKLTVLEALLDKVDRLIVGGGIANTFLAAGGVKVGKSLYEHDMLDMAHELSERARARGSPIPLPVDVVVARERAATAHADVREVGRVASDEMILDIGPDSAEQLCNLIGQAATIIWNGPVGVFEFDQFGEGTRAIANAIARSKAFSLAGGGDTLAAIEKYGVEDGISYISTGGGAFLEFVEGKPLPAVVVLEERAGRIAANMDP